ncbi:adenine deaminase C-terminal domain-containing protein, partial [Thermogutta sp.]|uniref:adenine deaminase C-terminal domain-containing protein n=1 Tax=Thermogutta sp. TaxID=1962930 RepID=UPI00322027F2
IFSGFVKGFGISKGALAITNQWDSSGIVVLGADDADMALAVNRVAELGGGISFYRGRREEFVLPLPIAGMIADLPVEELAARLTRLQSILEEAGSGLRDAMLSLETITSPAIPFIRLSAGGLVDVKNGRRLGLFVEAPTSSS